MAYATIWITVASLLSVFDIKKPVEKQTGRVIEPDVMYFSGIVR